MEREMKFGLLLSALLLLATPAMAAEYQGKNIDGRKLPAKLYSYRTGGVYDVQVQFNQSRATIYFVNGDKTTIKLSQKTITDPSDIEGVGRLGQVYLGGPFSVGLDYDRSADAQRLPGSQPLEDFWRISLDSTFNPSPVESQAPKTR